ncbi:acyl-CoA dehydrogenase family protein [Bdellovibrio sp. SKB1291214]|uniref:acyl-CoA dehydrogenase family protein n=1 Tax=Bdellovibrio sp. SKB1291214 TaxID=1732569 RepID=UPI000B69BFFF|nr:acyl-CoA dehydrogenase family protein [Bdellovibrio sp. SKB1291214]UYL07403.1 acyl-CoA dehydrogenase family protein [Bdellovibrio sp. SKB1291214]
MSDFWDEFAGKLKGAYEEAEKKRKSDFAMIKNLPGVIAYIKDLEGEELLLLLDQARKIKKRKNPKFPEINGDFYNTYDLLSEDEKAVITKVRSFMQSEVAPIVDEYWMKGEFPFQIIEKFKTLNICGLTYDKSFGGQQKSNLLEGMIGQEIARVDVSTCTFFGVHSGLAMNSIYMCGSDEQKRQFLPAMIKMEKIGAFALTEPEVGSAASMGLKTTCKRSGDHWTIRGEKKWIGNATFADHIIVWAKDVDDNQVKGFIVDRNTPGLETEKIEDKMALRIVQNAVIRLKDVKVPEERRLQNANSFKDTAKVLKATRAGVAWQAVGCARGAYEYTLKYTMDRRQFGRPISGFQMTQDLLSQMLSQLTAMQTMVSRLSQLQDEGRLADEQASLAKVFCTVGCRTITSMSRELMGANGILISNKVARFLGDAEALYSYEGTKQINSLVVGRAITGQSAFT